jgi:hypothetical protein
MTHWPKKSPSRTGLQFLKVPVLPITDDEEASALVKAGWSPGSQSNLTFNAWESRQIARCQAACKGQLLLVLRAFVDKAVFIPCMCLVGPHPT